MNRHNCKIDFEGKSINSGETYNKREQIQRSLAYGPSDMVLFEEAMINAHPLLQA